jgi:hypothetical protein
LAPIITLRDVPAELIAALQSRFGTNCSTAQVIREQHGRDESAFTRVPPPVAGVPPAAPRAAAPARVQCAARCPHRPTAQGSAAAAQTSQGGASYNNMLADSTGTGSDARVNFAAHAAAMGAVTFEVHSLTEFADALTKVDRNLMVNLVRFMGDSVLCLQDVSG